MAYGSRWESGWREYVPVHERRAAALLEMAALRKKGVDVQPLRVVKARGRKIARTVWGQAWCDHLEKFSDFANRLPRGRTYVRNGSVCHLALRAGEIQAKVSGSELYDVKIAIKPLPKPRWLAVTRTCAGRIGSLLELLQGRLSGDVMAVVTDRDTGLFPLPREIEMECSCPDWASMCKHVAAVMYGVGVRLDEKPELLFLLRGVDHAQLITEESARAIVGGAGRKGARGKSGEAHRAGSGDRRLDQSAIADVFGIEVVSPDGGGGGRGGRRGAGGAGASRGGSTRAEATTRERADAAKAAHARNGEPTDGATARSSRSAKSTSTTRATRRAAAPPKSGVAPKTGVAKAAPPPQSKREPKPPRSRSDPTRP